MTDINIGCSGFSYKHWKDVFYPHDLPPAKWLEFYATIFTTVELNVTFYHLPSETAFNTWYQHTPSDFAFAVKGSRYITHIKRLIDPAEALNKFFDGALLLKQKLKVVLWQFPPAFRADIGRLSSFLALLKKFPVRHVFEFRNQSWIVPSVVDLCREHNACLCMADSPDYIDTLPVTADFVYIRRHGHTAKNRGSYSKDQLAHDASRIRSYRKQGKDVFIYFNNDAYGFAPANARDLKTILTTARHILKKVS